MALRWKTHRCTTKPTHERTKWSAVKHLSPMFSDFASLIIGTGTLKPRHSKFGTTTFTWIINWPWERWVMIKLMVSAAVQILSINSNGTILIWGPHDHIRSACLEVKIKRSDRREEKTDLLLMRCTILGSLMLLVSWWTCPINWYPDHGFSYVLSQGAHTGIMPTRGSTNGNDMPIFEACRSRTISPLPRIMHGNSTGS